MVPFGDGRQESRNPSPEATLDNNSAAVSSPVSSNGPNTVVPPPLPPSHGSFCAPRASSTLNRTTGTNRSRLTHNGPPDEPSAAWDDDFWSDANTAIAVLTLLHKEPICSPTEPIRESENLQQNSQITCCACFEALEREFYPEMPIAAGCDHRSMADTYICVICLSRSLDVQFSASQVPILRCPLCCTPLTDEEAQRWASKPTFSAYDMAQTWRVLESDREFVKCINPRCCYGQLYAGEPKDPHIVCWACGTRTCFKHPNMPWHDG
ncbi:uncharacterized protein BDV14DRAFT_175798 [Aspergillus stella-maris]|uniref:uncharacterized protein n=1 Tax=Aspergillus stella-maris TaxID=1810926 RepID=UPI003CCDFCEA